MYVTDIFIPDFTTSCGIPMAGSKISAGFPSPADDYMEMSLDLNKELVKNPAATFFVRVTGDSMTDAGINDGDVLIVDRSVEVKKGKIVIAVINGELVVKRLLRKGRQLLLMPENPKYPPIIVPEEADFLIWGVVISVIHQF